MKTASLLLSLLLAPAFGQALKPVNETSYPQLITSAKGKVVLVDFWATWCKPCRAEMPLIAKLAAKMKSKGVETITVSADEPEAEAAAKKFLAETGAGTMPAYIKRPKDDDKFIALVDSKWSGELPALFLYDRAGKRVQSFFGETPIAQVEAAIRKLAP